MIFKQAIKIDDKRESVIYGLINALGAGDNAGMRNSAVEALTKIGEGAIEPLLGVINDDDRDIRKFVVDILGGIKNKKTIPVFIEGSDTQNPPAGWQSDP